MTDLPIALQETLSKLKDIHLPDDSLWWPPAPGVVVLSLLTLGLGCIILFKFAKTVQTYYYNRRIHLAISQLNSISLNQQQQHPIKIMSELSILLKRCAIAKYGDVSEVKSLSGYPWLEFLNRTGNTNQFTEGHGQLLITLPYLKEIDFGQYNETQLHQDINQAIEISKQWIKKNL